MKFVLPLLFGMALACERPMPTSSAQSSSRVPETSLTASQAPNSRGITIILVHGAWADATGWQEVIPILQREGYKVLAPQNALTSLSADVATTKRVIDAETRVNPVVVVGHSYGGTVVTEAAAGNASVRALVFLSAFTPEAGEPFGRFLGDYPTPLGAALTFDDAGFAYIDPTKFQSVFCADVQDRVARVLAVTQKPLSGAILGQAPAAAAWRTIPSWYLITLEDQAIHPDLQRLYATRMGAHIAEIRASHVSFISRPQEVARFILQAAASVSH
jgi:pimeloyl-ACP methyl ester carboxylesterase